MFITSKGIVLHRIKYGDNSFIVKAFTQTKGMLTFFLRISSKQRSSVNMFQPLTALELTFTYKGSKDMHYLKEFKPVDKNHLYTNDIRKIAVKSLISEFTYKCIHEENEDVDIFNFLMQQSNKLTHLHNGYNSFVLGFLFRFFELQGFSFMAYSENSSNEGFLNIDDLNMLDALKDEPDVSNFPQNNTGRANDLLDKMILCYKNAILGEKKILSIEIYKEVFYN